MGKPQQRKPPTDLRGLLSALERQDFDLNKVKNGHWQAVSPVTGRKCQFVATPGDCRSIKNATARLKKIGFDPRG